MSAFKTESPSEPGSQDRGTTRLIWIRHGEVHSDWHGRLYGRLDVPLSAEGEAQARAVVRELAQVTLQGIYSSGLVRARFTAELLHAARPRVPAQVRPDLHERDRGRWAAWPVERIEQEQPGALDLWRQTRGLFTPPGGETMAQVMERVGPELQRLLAKHPGQTIAIVAHLWVVRAAVAWTLGLSAERVAGLAIPTSGRVQLCWPQDARRADQGRLVEMLGTPEVLEVDRREAPGAP